MNAKFLDGCGLGVGLWVQVKMLKEAKLPFATGAEGMKEHASS